MIRFYAQSSGFAEYVTLLKFNFRVANAKKNNVENIYNDRAVGSQRNTDLLVYIREIISLQLFTCRYKDIDL